MEKNCFRCHVNFMNKIKSNLFRFITVLEYYVKIAEIDKL